MVVPSFRLEVSLPDERPAGKGTLRRPEHGRRYGAGSKLQADHALGEPEKVRASVVPFLRSSGGTRS
jgi:hypothetical protein